MGGDGVRGRSSPGSIGLSLPEPRSLQGLLEGDPASLAEVTRVLGALSPPQGAHAQNLHAPCIGHFLIKGNMLL